MSIAIDGTRYQWHGHAGPVVVLVHGLGLNQQMWQWQIPALKNNYRVLTYDLTGHGETPASATKPDLTLFSEQLYRLVTELDVSPCVVIGFSLGGMIVRRYAMDHPDLVSALGILSSAHRRETEAQQAILNRLAQVSEHGPQSTVEPALERWFTAEFRIHNPEVMAQVREWVLANDPAVYPDNYEVLATGVEELVAPDPPIVCPTLVMTADQDYGNSPQMTQAIAAEIKNSRTVILPGLRHMAMAENPELFNATLLSFLDDVCHPNR